MSFNALLRQTHRWLSIAFTVAAAVNIVAVLRKEPALWIGMLALVPLVLLLFTGLYLFVLPYSARWRGARQAVGQAEETA